MELLIWYGNGIFKSLIRATFPECASSLRMSFGMEY